jgi:hypothetical protein
MKNQEIQQFIKDTSFETIMSKGGLDSWSNYSGHDYTGWLCGLSYSRDSDVLAQSNFDSALEMLGGEIEGKVEVRDVNHWASGWFKQIMVNSKSIKHVKLLMDIKKQLDSYPVLDESDYSEREHEAYLEYSESEKSSLADSIEQVFNVKHTKQLEKLALEMNMECQQYYGSDSCINVNQYRGCDTRDIEKLQTVLKQLEFQFKSSSVYKKLVKAVNEYKVKE